MPSFSTSWCIGSIPFSSAATVTIDGSAESIAAGSYYLYDGTASRSLLDQFSNAMASAGLSPSVFLTESGHVFIQGGGGTFTVTWTDTTLRDALGFTGNLSGATSYTAPRWSTLFWSPTYVLQTATPCGIAYNRLPDTQIVMSRTGLSGQNVSNHEMQVQSFRADAVPIARVWTSNEYGGEYRKWHDTVFEPGYPFKVYDVTEDTASSTSQTLSTVVGPYAAADIEHEWYNRFIANADVATTIEFDCRIVTDL